ncbi:MAG: hypothetical protein J1F10_07455 [Muribaculaceae bacterium]|nr:hypothetical protein [Muribaculaceae bacterium]
MKKLIILSTFIAIAFVISASIPDELTEEYGQTIFSVSDPEYEWSQIDTKQIKVGFKSQSLQFESKQNNGFAYSVVELPINVEDNAEFLFGINLKGFKPNDSSKEEKFSKENKFISKAASKAENVDATNMINSSFGMIFDYQDIRNYKGLAISKKEYQYYMVKDGIVSMVKRGPVKYEGDIFKLIMRRENGGIEFLLNGIEVCNLRKIKLTSSFFGVFINGKGKAEMPSFIMYISEQEDTEQSTSNT